MVYSIIADWGSAHAQSAIGCPLGESTICNGRRTGSFSRLPLLHGFHQHTYRMMGLTAYGRKQPHCIQCGYAPRKARTAIVASAAFDHSLISAATAVGRTIEPDIEVMLGIQKPCVLLTPGS